MFVWSLINGSIANFWSICAKQVKLLLRQWYLWVRRQSLIHSENRHNRLNSVINMIVLYNICAESNYISPNHVEASVSIIRHTTIQTLASARLLGSPQSPQYLNRSLCGEARSWVSSPPRRTKQPGLPYSLNWSRSWNYFKIFFVVKTFKCTVFERHSWAVSCLSGGFEALEGSHP